MRKEKGFDCPICKTRCYVIRNAASHRDKTQIKHPLPLCKGFEPKLLMQAYVLACNPRTRFPGINEIAKEVYEKGVD